MAKQYKDLTEKQKRELEKFGFDERLINLGLMTPPSVTLLPEINIQAIKRRESFQTVVSKTNRFSIEEKKALLYIWGRNGKAEDVTQLNFEFLRGVRERALEVEQERQRFKAKIARKRTAEQILIQYLPHLDVESIFRNEIEPTLKRSTAKELLDVRDKILKGQIVLETKDRALTLLEIWISKKETDQKIEKVNEDKRTAIDLLETSLGRKSNLDRIKSALSRKKEPNDPSVV